MKIGKTLGEKTGLKFTPQGNKTTPIGIEI